MALSEAQKRANLKYQREHTKSINLRFYPDDMTLYEYLNTVDNKQGYIKSLIRADMEKHRS